ncbi:hypothetical protein BJX65DRAFT_299556 [Aspergillus insuetus]
MATLERPACDLCHDRKVKCDRYDPCMKCVDARTECRRTRSRRNMRPRGLSDRLSTLEQFIQFDTPSHDPRRREENNVRDVPALHPPSAGAWDRRSPGSNNPGQRVTLERSDNFTLQRRTLLENTLLLINKLTSAAPETKLASQNIRPLEYRDPADLPEFSIETYYMMSKHVTHQHSPGKHLHWPDHVSPKGLEHMTRGFACISNQRMKNTLKAAFMALDQISFVGNHSISLVQALLSALLHQMQGNITKAWALTSFAAQLLVAMSYHTVSDKTPIQSQEDEDARFCLFSCHYLDKSLSMHLLRPASLPRLRVIPASASLVPVDDEIGLSAIAKTMAELAEIQEPALEIFHPRVVPLGEQGEKPCRLDAVIQQLISLRSVIEESNQDTPLEWIGTEFRKDEYMQSAREALQALSRLQNIINTDPVFIGSYSILLSSLADFQLLCDITRGLAQFTSFNPAIANLYQLFTTFLNLCSPVAQIMYKDENSTAMYIRPEMGSCTQPSLQWVDSENTNVTEFL